MSGETNTPIDLWELAKYKNYTANDYYMDSYDDRSLYIKHAYYSDKNNKKYILRAFHIAKEKNSHIPERQNYKRYHLRMQRTDHEGVGMYKQIDTIEDLNKFLRQSAKKEGVYISNPGEYDEEGNIFLHPTQVGIHRKSSSGGRATYEKTTLKKMVFGRERVIYLGAHHKHFVKMKGEFVSVK